MRLVAWVVTVLGACGDGVGAPDATQPPDADVGVVRVRYRGSALEHNPVFFQNADGSLVLATHTGVDGTANAYMAPGGTVTLVVLEGNTQFLYTWIAVEPGDELVKDRRQPDELPATRLTIAIPIDPGAGFYQLQTSCGFENVSPAAGTSLVIDLGDCRGRADMFVFTLGAGLHYLYAEDVAATNGSTVTLPPPYRPFERSTIEIRGAPATTTTMEVSQRLIGEGRALFDPVDAGFALSNVAVPEGAGTTNFDMPLPPSATMLTTVSPLDGLGLGRPFVARWGPTQPTTTIDFSPLVLRPYLTRARYDPPTHSLVWTESDIGVVATAVLATWTWFRPEIGGNYQWQIIAPRGVDPVIALPVLPDPQYLPRANDTIVQPYSLVSIASRGGYAPLRRRLIETWTRADSWPAESASGEVVYEELTEPFAQE